MPAAKKPSNECARIAALIQYRVLDTEPEACFDDFTKLASLICGTPISLVSLLDTHRQWFKSKVGLEARETHRDKAFCAHAILDSSNVMVVPDATEDERFCDNDLVMGEPGIRFYAGAPLLNHEGFPLGTLCVIDRVPRDLTEDQKMALSVLGQRVVAQLEFRKVSFRLADALENISTLQALLPICSHCRRVRDDDGYWSMVDEYVREHSDTDFTHGICPDCLDEKYPQFSDRTKPEISGRIA